MIDYVRTEAAARAAVKAGKWSSAARLWKSVVERNPVDGALWYELAGARFRADDHAGALAAYERALRLGVWRPDDLVLPSHIEYRIACCHARLGDVGQAVAALRRAMGAGLRDIDKPWDDPLLADLRDEPWFAETFTPLDTADLSRDEGWRADLWLFAREVPRRAYRPPGPSFDDDVAKLAEAIPRLTDAEIVVALTRLLRPLGDGHAYIELPARHELRAALPLLFFLFEEGLHVVAAEPDHRHLLGARVTRIDGRPSEDVLAALDPVLA